MSLAATNAELARAYGLNAIELNQFGTGDRETLVRLYGDDSYTTDDGSACLRRVGGVNGAAVVSHRGTFSLRFSNVEAAPHVFYLTNTAGTPVETHRFDSDGRFIKPNQRMFHARYTNAAAFGSGVTIVFNDVQANVGSHYNAASGIFTAPYNGLYLFTCHILMSTTTTADTRLAIQKNNAAYAGASFIRSAAVAGVNSLYGTAVFALLANDTARVCAISASSQFYQNADNANYSGFCGYLLG
jgi:hypothetical protein